MNLAEQCYVDNVFKTHSPITEPHSEGTRPRSKNDMPKLNCLLMNRFIDNWMRWFNRSLYRLGGKGAKRRRKRVNQCLLLFLTVAVISACASTTANQNQPSDSQADSTDCRTVQHLMGETCVPIDPQQVVVFSGSLDTVLSLGVKPVGSVQVRPNDYYLKKQAEGIKNIGSPGSPNLESIKLLKPDLILGSEWNKKDYQLLSQIAPTVIADVDSGGEWKRMLSKYAEALGKTDKAEQIILDYNVRIEEFKAQMGDRLKETEVSIVRVRQDVINIYLEESFSGAMVADADLPRPPQQTNTGETSRIDISKELLHKADGDVVFVWTYGVSAEMAQDAQTKLRELKTAPLWSKLNAVQQGRVYDVPGYWYGMGPIAANLVLDDLFKYLVDSPSQAAQ